MAYRTEQLYKEACEVLKKQIADGTIASHSISDAVYCIVSSLWESEWYKQKRTNLIRKIE